MNLDLDLDLEAGILDTPDVRTFGILDTWTAGYKGLLTHMNCKIDVASYPRCDKMRHRCFRSCCFMFAVLFDAERRATCIARTTRPRSADRLVQCWSHSAMDCRGLTSPGIVPRSYTSQHVLPRPEKNVSARRSDSNAPSSRPRSKDRQSVVSLRDRWTCRPSDILLVVAY